MPDLLLDAGTVVLRRIMRGGVMFEFRDRGGTVLATAREPRRRRKPLTWDRFGDWKSSARRLLVSDPAGTPHFLVYKQWTPLWRPIQVWNADGELTGTIEATSRDLLRPAFVLSDREGTTHGKITGTHDQLDLTDRDGRPVAELIKEGDSQVLIVRRSMTHPLRTLATAALPATELLIWNTARRGLGT